MPDYTSFIIGDTEKEIEALFDAFLDRMEQFDKKTSAQTQRKILREAIAPAVVDLRKATRSEYTARTGRSRRSVRTTVKASKKRPGIQYATYGWSNKGIQPIYYMSRKGRRRERPKPALYIGVWQDLGTQHVPEHYIFEPQWRAHKNRIIGVLTEKIQAIMRESKISK